MKVLSWYEFLFAVGSNIGPGLPILFSFVNIQAGWLRVNKYNAVQFFIVGIGFLMFVISWFLVIDLSKGLEKLGKDAMIVARGKVEEGSGKKQLDVIDRIQERKLMAWKELLRVDILSSH